MLINHEVKYDVRDKQLDLLFMALSDPTRRRILDILSRGDATVNELARHFPMSLPAVSKHLKVLENAGLITRGRSAQWRPCRLNPEALREGADYMTQYRELWEASLKNLGSYISELQRKRKESKKG